MGCGWWYAGDDQDKVNMLIPREMLLLAAIHFHAGQLSAVADLVCQTLDIKMTVRTNTMTAIKKIFTQVEKQRNISS